MKMAATMQGTATQVQTRQRPWWLTLINGILAVLIGSILLWAPAKAKVDVYLFLVTFLGFYWMFEGIFTIIAMFIDHTAWAWKLFIGIISIMAGSTIVMYPLVSALALPKIFALVLGIWGLMYGVLLLIMAFRGGGWGAGILGVIGILCGFALMVNYYVIGMGLAMLWMAAVTAVVGGIMMIVQSFRQRAA
jgi:uncharacterized membrane protein HdeD (DUF308 family)